jgi:hypothetical protein
LLVSRARARVFVCISPLLRCRCQLLSEVTEVTPAPAFDPATCVPFTRTGGAGLTWAEAPWAPAPGVKRAPAAAAGAAGLGTAHGKWCGAGHGGFHDCCEGAACKACSAAAGADAACLAACPPADEVDGACAAHDACLAKLDGGAEQQCGPGGACAPVV